MAEHLPTSNMSVNVLLSMLGVTSPKAIFYKGVGLITLKTVAELGATVNKLWLGSACPGTTADEKLTNLLADRKLSYFKYYGYNDNITFSPSYGANFQSVPTTLKPDTMYTPITTTQAGYKETITTHTASIQIGGTWAGLNLRLNWLVDGVVKNYVNIPSAGTYNLVIGTGLTYPQTGRLSISSY